MRNMEKFKQLLNFERSQYHAFVEISYHHIGISTSPIRGCDSIINNKKGEPTNKSHGNVYL